jgi:hypothetical protein
MGLPEEESEKNKKSFWLGEERRGVPGLVAAAACLVMRLSDLSDFCKRCGCVRHGCEIPNSIDFEPEGNGSSQKVFFAR